MRFALMIELGNDAMQTPADVADALKTVANKLENESPGDELVVGDTMPIRDVNGNRVGEWKVLP